MEKSTIEDDKIYWKCNKIINIIEKMYEKTTCAVVVDGLLTEWFSVSVGVRQGRLNSPNLFNLFLDFVVDELKCLQEHVTLDYELNFDERYVDDTTLIAGVFEKLQLITDINYKKPRSLFQTVP